MTSSASATSTMAATAARRQWWWLQLLPPPVARACERLLLRLVALWLSSPLRRLRLGQRSARALAAALGDAEDAENDGDEQMRSATTSPVSDADMRSWCGLANVGNTCFVNATLQCVAALPGLRVRVARELAALKRRAAQEASGVSVERESLWLRQIRTVDALLVLLASLDRRGDVDIDEDDDSDEADNEAASEGRVQRVSSSAGAATAVDRETLRAQVRAFLDAAAETSELVARMWETQEQQDAEEFLSFLLELLHELLRPVRAGAELRALNDREHEYFRQGEAFYAKELKRCHPLDPRTYTDVVSGLGDLRWQRFLRQNDSVVTDLFVGQIVRGSQCCSCANLTCLHQELRVLSLSVDASASAQSLATCLEAHRHAETLVDDNRVFCEGYCHMKTSRNTQVLFQRAPPVLVVQLQRFKQSSWGLEKIGVPVSFPAGEKEVVDAAAASSSSSMLDLTANMFVRNAAQRVLYALVAVCAHVGPSIDSGHYIAYVRHQQQQPEDTASEDEEEDRSRRPAQWLRMDDDVVTVLDEDEFRGETLSTAYLLFYVRVAS